MKKDIVLLELFSGIGGFAKGISDAGYTIKKHYFSEIDKHAIANYKYNFKKSEYVGSVTDVRGSSIERPDIITFGSPCQDFSLAGKRAGMEGSRSSLILEAIRIITETKPSVFVWENVKGAFSSNDGADFWGIIAAFTNIRGYRLEWQLCNTSWFLPQNRERIYLVGHLAGRSELGVFPFTKDGGLFNGSKESEKRQSQTENCSTIGLGFGSKADNTFVEVPKIAGCLTGGGHSGGLHSDMTTIKLNQKECTKGNSQGNRIYEIDGLSSTISSAGGGLGGKTGLYEVKTNIKAVVKPVLTPDRLEKRQNGRRIKEDGEDAFTLSCQDQHGVQINDTIRRLTEIECERLQGFPDDWTKFGIYLKPSVQKYIYGSKKRWRTAKALHNLYVFAVNNTTLIEKEIPKTQRYKMCGNAVTTDLPREIAKRLKLS